MDLQPKYVNQLEQDSHDNSANITAKRSALYGWNPTTLQYERLTSANGLLQTAGSLVSSPLTGQVKIAVSGTAVQLPTNTLTNGVILIAKSTNSAPLLIGASSVTNTVDGTGNGAILEAGAMISFAVTNSNDIYVNGTAGDILSFAGS